MKAPVSWLKEYVSFEDSIEGLVEKLTFSGIEVEGVETIGGDFEGLVVGEVTAVDPHPNADRLKLCAVETGSGSARVVCGAPSVKTGGKYAFAPVGVTLPNGIKLKKAKIRGEPSEGMLCAEDELGLSDDHEGLLELDGSLTAGTALADVLGPPEVVLELEITPNRPDCLSMIGVARELSALYGAPLVLPAVDFEDSAEPVESVTSISVEELNACPRYVGRVFFDIRVGEAPPWMKKRLNLAGIRPINNVVDITNYVLLETGQPLHAFDKALLHGERIVVRRARPGEIMHTLDEVERSFEEEVLLIADADRAVAVAGVMGGADSEIRPDTGTVLLESACFDASGVRATSRRLGLSTESSYRFERGVDSAQVDWASRRAARLLVEHAGARAARGSIDIYPNPPAAREIECRFDRVCAVIGLELSGGQIEAILQSLGMETVKTTDHACTLRIPSFRNDLQREVDLIEEVARIHGLDKIPAPSPRSELVPGADDHAHRAVSALRARLVGLGLREVMNYSTTSPGLLDQVAVDVPEARVVLPHPLSQDHSVLRSSLIPQMVESLGRNASRQILEALFFEVGRTFHRMAGGELREEGRLAAGLLGAVGRQGLGSERPAAPEEMFSWIKGLWEALAEAQGLGRWSLEAGDHSGFEPGFSAALSVGGEVAGRMGVLARSIGSKWRISDPVGVLEVRLAVLLKATAEPPELREVPVFPAISRDVALVVAESVTHQSVLDVVEREAPKELESVRIFDIFYSEGIGKGKKSLAYSFTYRSPERTLTDEDANAHHHRIKEALRESLRAEIRDH